MGMKRLLLIIVLIGILTACSVQGETAAISGIDANVAITPTKPFSGVSATPTPEIILPTNTAVPTVSFTATVWETEPITAVLTYHQFAQNHAEKSTSLKVRLEDFENQLQSMYDAGFSLVTLEDWLAGNITVPEGRRPLILSMDDAYFNNQISLDENGEIMADTGIGVLWNFYQTHPDFGHSMALFINLGDKLYADPDDPGWEMQLAEAIAWGMDRDVMPYNHFYTHPKLDITSGANILWELEHNDVYLRELLTMAGREDLIPELRNILALTYGIWPQIGSIPTMLSYTTPEGIPVEAVMEIDPIHLEKYMQPPWSPDYNLLYMPRHVASPQSIVFLVENAEKFPQAQVCELEGLPMSAAEGPAALVEVLGAFAAEAGCPSGSYVIEGTAYRVDVEAETAEVLEITTEVVFEY